MKEDNIRVLKVEPQKEPEVVTLKNDLESMQEAVGGLIEIIDLSETACVLCNEEGKLNGLEGNRSLTCLQMVLACPPMPLSLITLEQLTYLNCWISNFQGTREE